MVKLKAASTLAKKALKTRAGKGAAAVIGTEAAGEIIEVIDNPYLNAGVGAAEGALLGAAVGGPIGAVGGAVAGGLVGFFLADGERITPCAMIAIPAYQYSAVLAGREPTFQLFIKEGELITPVLPTEFMKASAAVSVATELVKTKPRKKSAWQRYMGQKKNQIKFRNGKLNLKAMSKAGGFGKHAKKGGKK